MGVFRRLTAQWVERYRKMSIQMVLSLSFTAVAAAAMLLMSVSLLWRFASASEELASQAAMLRELVARFRLKGQEF